MNSVSLDSLILFKIHYSQSSYGSSIHELLRCSSLDSKAVWNGLCDSIKLHRSNSCDAMAAWNRVMRLGLSLRLSLWYEMRKERLL